MTVPDPERDLTRRKRECSTAGEAIMGVSGGTAGNSRKERDDGGDIPHGSKRSDYRRLLEDLEILESSLGEEVHGQKVLCEEYDFRGVPSGTLEYVNQTATGLVPVIPHVPVQNGPGVSV